jgi:small subunit ribosomal protein S16
MGRCNRALYRIVAADGRVKRDGKTLEDLGRYDPEAAGDKFSLKLDRVEYWLSVGAQPSDPVAKILRKAGMPAGRFRRSHAAPALEGARPAAAQ